MTPETLTHENIVVQSDFFLERDLHEEIVGGADYSSKEELEDGSDENFVPSGKGKALPVVPRETYKCNAGEQPKYTTEKELPVAPRDLVPYKPGVKGKEKRKYPIQHFTDLEDKYMADVEENVDEVQPEDGDWSGIIHLGSPASNQSMYLIYHEIKGEQDD